jgi:hypothetical protein
MQLQSNHCELSCALPSTAANTVSRWPWEKFRTSSTAAVPKYQASTWVKLWNPPTAYSFDEAWLLCQYSDDQWLAWIPDYGEILLNTSEFC